MEETEMNDMADNLDKYIKMQQAASAAVSGRDPFAPQNPQYQNSHSSNFRRNSYSRSDSNSFAEPQNQYAGYQGYSGASAPQNGYPGSNTQYQGYSGAFAPQNSYHGGSSDPYSAGTVQPIDTNQYRTLDIKPLTITQFKQLVTNALDNYFADTMTIIGEISNFRAWNNTIYYFSLSDGSNTAEFTMPVKYADPLIRQTGLKDGMQVIVQALKPRYRRTGRLQIDVTRITPVGAGILEQQLQMLKERLAKEGLFAPEHKKPIPLFPKTVGVITSPSGDVIHDIYTNLFEKFPSINLIIYPATVQGDSAPDSLTRALNLANYRNECDVIIIARGGGSFEDLFCFNDERLVRAIYNSRIPVISAVGHETDTTLCDFAADLRVATPTHAATCIAQNYENALNNITSCEKFLQNKMGEILRSKRELTDNFLKNLYALTPRHRIENSRNMLDKKLAELIGTMGDIFRIKRDTVNTCGSNVYRFGIESNISGKIREVGNLHNRLLTFASARLTSSGNRLDELTRTLGNNNPLYRIQNLKTGLNSAAGLLEKNLISKVNSRRIGIEEISNRISRSGIETKISAYHGQINNSVHQLIQLINTIRNTAFKNLTEFEKALNSLNPQNRISRYEISLNTLSGALDRLATRLLNDKRQELNSLNTEVSKYDIASRISSYKNEVIELTNRMYQEINERINRHYRDLEKLANNMNRKNPLADPRFYKTTTMHNGQALSSASSVKKGDRLITLLHDGEIESTVTEITQKKDNS